MSTGKTVAMAAAITASKFMKVCGGRHRGGLSAVAGVRFLHFPPFAAKSSRSRAGLGIKNLAYSFSAARHLPIPPFCTSANEAAAAAVATAEQQESKDGSESGGSILDAANLLDIRVGRIVKAWRHEEADSLYVEEVDVGEEAPRVICSGLVKYVLLQDLQDRKVVVLANLKPRNMRGVKSFGMLMAASDAAHENVELLDPPEGSDPGDRIWFGGTRDEKLNQPPAPAPASPNQIQKKKIWESVQPHLSTDESCVAKLGEHLMWTSAGAVVCRSLKNARIS